MHVLLLSVQTGFGHQNAANAVAEALASRGHQVRQADLLRCCGLPPRLADLVYRFSAAFLKGPFRRVYARLERQPELRRRLRPWFAPHWLAPRLSKWLKREPPDCILTTHVFAALVLGDLAGAGLLSAPVLGLVTDYCLHPFWEDCRFLRALILPSPSLAPEALGRGISREQLLPLGIPVRSACRIPLERGVCRRSLGLPEGSTVLLMGGSMGYGRLFGTALALRRQKGLHTVCVCGRNRPLRLLLLPFGGRRLRVLGFTDKLPQYIRAADLAVTKPGGITLTELAVAGLPALLVNPIPGHEERNLLFWLTAGGCRTPERRGCRETARAAAALLSDRDAMFTMKRAMETAALPQAAENICKLVEALDKAGKHDRI